MSAASEQVRVIIGDLCRAWDAADANACGASFSESAIDVMLRVDGRPE
jgi:hypothetical protein